MFREMLILVCFFSFSDGVYCGTYDTHFSVVIKLTVLDSKTCV